MGPKESAGHHGKSGNPPDAAAATHQVVNQQPSERHLEHHQGVHPVLGGVAHRKGRQCEYGNSHPGQQTPAESPTGEPDGHRRSNGEQSRQRPQPGVPILADECPPVVRQQVVQRRMTVGAQGVEDFRRWKFRNVRGEGLVEPHGAGGHESKDHPGDTGQADEDHKLRGQPAEAVAFLTWCSPCHTGQRSGRTWHIWGTRGA